ncbi:MAG: TonB C-terminal domain-containing protein [Candidatus Solibacter usitatus]|nr:TonB C-terminal domain-containing protein [Candidatus Solibacter usitatus]
MTRLAYSGMSRTQPMARPLVASTAMHLMMTTGFLGWNWWVNRARETLGDPNSQAGPGYIETVDRIPMPRKSGETSPVVRESESQAPVEKKPKAKAVEKDDPDAIALPTKKKKKEPPKKEKEERRRFVPEQYDPVKQQASNQVYSDTGKRMNSPLYQMPGGGGVGVGQGNPFGTRLGWYVDLIRIRIGQQWRTQDVEAGLTSAPVVIVVFDIQRNGDITNAKIVQTSGNYSLDNSALRAIRDASPLAPLPPEFDRKSANVEFQFQFKR